MFFCYHIILLGVGKNYWTFKLLNISVIELDKKDRNVMRWQNFIEFGPKKKLKHHLYVISVLKFYFNNWLKFLEAKINWASSKSIQCKYYLKWLTRFYLIRYTFIGKRRLKNYRQNKEVLRNQSGQDLRRR